MMNGFLSSAWKRERMIALAGLAAITLIAWVYVIHAAGSETSMVSSGMQGMSMPVMQTWLPGDFLSTFLMWTVMMAGMMMPSAAPMILTFLGISRRRQTDQAALPSTLTFILGYLAAWALFSAVATLMQWGLRAANLMSPAMAGANPVFQGTLVILAGIYQCTPLKKACLSSCRTPLGFLMAEWRDGSGGAFRMGVHHGVDCVGCCWLLMALFFAVGVMNLLWSAIIATVVLLEKVIPGGLWISRLIGVLAMGWGALLIVHAAGM
jgi:predicted metal-binding membrane protein